MEVKFAEPALVHITSSERTILLSSAVGLLTERARSTTPMDYLESVTLGKIITHLTLYPNRRTLRVETRHLPLLAECFEYTNLVPKPTEQEQYAAAEAALILRGELQMRDFVIHAPDVEG